MNLRDFYQTSMEPNPFVASELDLDFTHISIYTYISNVFIPSYLQNEKRIYHCTIHNADKKCRKTFSFKKYWLFCVNI